MGSPFFIRTFSIGNHFAQTLGNSHEKWKFRTTLYRVRTRFAYFAHFPMIFAQFRSKFAQNPIPTQVYFSKKNIFPYFSCKKVTQTG